jgi:hypothetical protein
MSNKNLVNCDTRVKPEIKNKLTIIAKKLKMRRSDLQRAAFNLIIEQHEELLNGKADGSKEDH